MSPDLLQRSANLVRAGILAATLVAWLGYFGSIQPERAFAVELGQIELVNTTHASRVDPSARLRDFPLNCLGPSDRESRKSLKQAARILELISFITAVVLALWMVRRTGRLQKAMRLAERRLEAVTERLSR